MDVLPIFGLQFLLGLVVWSVILGFLLNPWLATKPRYDALLWLSLPRVFRHVGMVFLVPGVVDRPLPAELSGPAAHACRARDVILRTGDPA